eukprot:8643664-Pyramimonas_sp.AAC.1
MDPGSGDGQIWTDLPLPAFLDQFSRGPSSSEPLGASSLAGLYRPCDARLAKPGRRTHRS